MKKLIAPVLALALSIPYAYANRPELGAYGAHVAHEIIIGNGSCENEEFITSWNTRISHEDEALLAESLTIAFWDAPDEFLAPLRPVRSELTSLLETYHACINHTVARLYAAIQEGYTPRGIAPWVVPYLHQGLEWYAQNQTSDIPPIYRWIIESNMRRNQHRFTLEGITQQE